MKNILNIASHDLRKCGSSVVAIITIMGLCIIPCLYAWFNIFSNWAPYESAATGRISVAVANEDEGASAIGITVNVGEKIVGGLEANNDIGWVFVDSSDEAIEGVKAGDYYAALVIPKDFSSGVLSFIGGDLTNPKLEYYENEKKNAIAPKITGKAKTAVQEEVNATFVETLAAYVSDAVSIADATGFSTQDVFSDLSERIALLSDRLDNCLVMLDAADSLSDAAESLLTVSGTLTDSAGGAVKSEKKVLDSASGIATEDDSEYTKMTESVGKVSDRNKSRLNDLKSKLTPAVDDRDKYNDFVANDLDFQKKSVAEMIKANNTASDSLKKLGLNTLAGKFEELNTDLNAIAEKLDMLEPATDENWAEMQQNVRDIQDIITGKSGASDKTDAISDSLKKDDLATLDKKLKNALRDTKTSISNMQDSLDGMGGLLAQMGKIFGKYNGSLGKLEGNMGSTRSDIISMRRGLDVLAALWAKSREARISITQTVFCRKILTDLQRIWHHLSA